MFFEGFAGTFDLLFEVLGDGLLASYLLGYEQAGEDAGAPGDAGAPSFDEPTIFNFKLPPEKAIAYFKSKKVVTRSKFNRLSREARAGAFTVGGVYRTDTLTAFKDEIAAALENGTAQREVIKRFRSIVDGATGQKQLGNFQLETVFRTNMQTAYGVGRRRGQEEVADLLPLWEYNAVMDSRTRPAHAALNGIILPATHEFWESHYPPWDFACRCNVTARATEPYGYDHTNPSGEAEISYDKKGIPAKAEVGTAVYDLGVGKFKGIPSQGGLQETIDSGVRRAKGWKDADAIYKLRR